MEDAQVIDGTAEEMPPDPHHDEPAPAGTAMVAAPHQGGQTALIQASSPDEMIEKATSIAKSLDRIIKAQGLSTKIGNKDHVNIEAWQTLATLLGAAPVIRWTRRVTDPETGKPEKVEYEVKVTDYEWVTPEGGGRKQKRAKADRFYTVTGYNWEACCDVIKDGVVIASAESMVTRTEDKWAQSDDYAVRSMAQTRAQSRAIAAAARWVVTLAGYAGTPTEEMDGTKAGASAQQQAQNTGPQNGPAIAQADRAKILEAITFLAADGLATAATVNLPAPREVGIAIGKAISAKAGGYMPAIVGTALLEIANARTTRAEALTAAQAQDADAEAGDGPPPGTGEPDDRPVPSSIDADTPLAREACICPDGFDAAQESEEKRSSDCAVIGHGIPF